MVDSHHAGSLVQVEKLPETLKFYVYLQLHIVEGLSRLDKMSKRRADLTRRCNAPNYCIGETRVADETAPTDQGLTTLNSLAGLAKWPRTAGLPIFEVMVAETL